MLLDSITVSIFEVILVDFDKYWFWYWDGQMEMGVGWWENFGQKIGKSSIIWKYRYEWGSAWKEVFGLKSAQKELIKMKMKETFNIAQPLI